MVTVPAGVTLDLSDLKSGANVVFSGTTTFGEKVSSYLEAVLEGSTSKLPGCALILFRNGRVLSSSSRAPS
jgi:hypothetical protein